MRFWGATVITNLFSAIPFIGGYIVTFIWGGFAINNATLNRFFVLHFLLPFILLILILIHIYFLHLKGSSNPLGINNSVDWVKFHPFYTSKDIVGFIFFLFFSCLIIFFIPWAFSEPDNFTPANPLVTPLTIKPEWYFLWAYAILRAVPSKLGGVLTIFRAILILYVPLFFKNIRKVGSQSYTITSIIFWCFISIVIYLTILGGLPVYVVVEFHSRIFTSLFFLSFLFYLLIPLAEEVFVLIGNFYGFYLTISSKYYSAIENFIKLTQK